MKKSVSNFLLFASVLILACNSNGNNTATDGGENKTPATEAQTAMTEPLNEINQESIIGEWEKQYEAVDLNGNKRIDKTEMDDAAAGKKEYLRFNADGTCQYTDFFKNKQESPYQFKTEGDSKKIYIENKIKSEGNAGIFNIISVSKDELVLSTPAGPTVYDVYKRL